MRPLILSALLLAVAACDSSGPDAGDLSLTVTGNRFVAGSSVEATVENRSGRTLYLYDCGGRVLLDVQEQNGAEWETVGFVNNDCATTYVVPYPLGAESGQTVRFAVERPGTYRLRTAFGTEPGPGTDVGGPDWLEAVSETFSVISE